MKMKFYFLLMMVCFFGIVSTGCKSTSTEEETTTSQMSTAEKVEKVVVKGAVKMAIRNSPLSIINATK